MTTGRKRIGRGKPQSAEAERAFYNGAPPGKTAFFGGPAIQRQPGAGRAAEGGASTRALPRDLAANVEALSGHSLAGVRVTYNSEAPERIGALAYARAPEIHIAPGQEGHLPHEAWHIVQQRQGRVPATSRVGEEPVNDDPSLEREASDMGSLAARMQPRAYTPGSGHGNGCGCSGCIGQAQRSAVGAVVAGPRAFQRASTGAGVIQRARPDDVVDHTFLGRGVAVNPTMRDRLNLVQAHLQAEYDALPEEYRPATLREYAGVNSIGGWRETTSLHGTGRAVDVNYQPQPYIATRTTEGGVTTYGGEQGGATAETRALRRPAVEVYDRAMSFTWTNPYDSDTADVGNRRVGETATEAYRRFQAVSDALVEYLGLAFKTDYDDVQRAPVRDPETIAEDELLNAIPTTERKEEATAVAEIQAYMDNMFWEALHPSYPLTAREQYIRILRDYEIVRRPMQYGNPSTSPARTRNPARGFLHLPEHFVVAMMDVGRLRWGACEFSAASNGDVHHFDLGTPYHSPVPQPAPSEEAPE